MESNKPIAYWTDDERWMIDDGEHGFPREADQDEIALAEALRERDACHAIWDELFRIMGYAPEGPRPMLVDAVRALAQGIVKEGPSVDRLVTAVDELLRLKDEKERIAAIERRDPCHATNFLDKQDYLKAKGPAWDELRAARAALFTQTQVEPGSNYDKALRKQAQELADNNGIRLEYRDGNHFYYAWHDGGLLWSGDPWFNIAVIGQALIGKGNLLAWIDHNRARVAQGIEAAPRSAKREEYSGEPGPTKEDAPKTNEEQSEDAALPDGRWIPVSERLPQRGLTVIACHQPSRQVYCAACYDLPGNVVHKHDWIDPHGLMRDVTHWMPLPTPPTN